MKYVSTIIHRILETGALLIVDVMNIGTKLGIPLSNNIKNVLLSGHFRSCRIHRNECYMAKTISPSFHVDITNQAILITGCINWSYEGGIGRTMAVPSELAN